MPNRYIREGIIESEAVNSLSWEAEVFYRRLLNRVDDFGRFTANPELLRSKLYPLQLSKVQSADIAQMLAECERAGLIATWTSDRKAYLVLNKWEIGRAKSSDYPDPPPDICKHLQTYVNRRWKVLAVSESESESESESDTDSVGLDCLTQTPLTGDALGTCSGPPWDSVREFAEKIGMAEKNARAWFDGMRKRDWKHNGRDVVDWKKFLTGKQRMLTADAKRGRNNGHLSVLDLKTVIAAKEEKATKLKHAHCTESGLGDTWKSEEARQKWSELRKQIKELKNRLAGMA